ncbi:MAG TPA: DUF3047 domain-containing protein, partial [Rhodocyclaceae bacterium]|nr:DUF3047 domain-containing protein [Rhodocyclaceae bacterium]
GRSFPRLAAGLNMLRSIFLAALLGLLVGPAAAASAWVGQFALAEAVPPAPWQLERFDKKIAATQYRVRDWDGLVAVEAQAKKSMAVLVRPLAVDLDATPFLCWRWRVEATIANADITSKAGDDYAARVYLMYRMAESDLGFATRAQLALARALRGEQVPDAAVNYVWDNRSPVGTLRPNAYTERAMMWVLRSGDSEAGRWVSERRDVRADFARAFKHRPRSLYAMALASDTDNTGGSATAGFAELRFVSADEACGS